MALKAPTLWLLQNPAPIPLLSPAGTLGGLFHTTMPLHLHAPCPECQHDPQKSASPPSPPATPIIRTVGHSWGDIPAAGQWAVCPFISQLRKLRPPQRWPKGATASLRPPAPHGEQCAPSCRVAPFPSARPGPQKLTLPQSQSCHCRQLINQAAPTYQPSTRDTFRKG